MKDTWTKPKGVGSRVGGGDGWGAGCGGVKMETIEQQFKKKKQGNMCTKKMLFGKNYQALQTSLGFGFVLKSHSINNL